MQQLYTLKGIDWDPLHNPARLSALSEHDVFDSSPEVTFDSLARLASLACQTSSAMIAFANDQALYYKSSINFDEDRLRHFAESIFPLILTANSPVILDSRLQAGHCRLEPDGFQLMATVPIKSHENHLIGVLCVADDVVREITDAQLQALSALADQIEHELSTRCLVKAYQRHVADCQSDVEKLRLSESRLEAALASMSLVNEIGKAARSGDSADAILAMAVEKLGSAILADRCYYVTYDALASAGRIGPDWSREGLKSISGTYNMFDFPYNKDPSFHSGKTSIIEDLCEIADGPSAALSLSLGLRSLLRAPIQRGNRMTALGVAMGSPRKWTEDEIRLVETVAAQTRAAVETASQILREKTLLRDVLVSVTEGKLRLADSERTLPDLFDPIGDPVTLNRGSGLSELRRLTKQASTMAEHSEVRSYDLMMAAGEAGMNAIVHAKTGLASVHVGKQGIVQVRVIDHGSGIALENIPKATLARGYSTTATLGHGLKMMLETVDRLHLLTGTTGTTVVLEQEKNEPEVSWNIPV